jgi:predicted transcriptional regulator
MAQVHISDELDARLERAAARLGCTKDEFVEETIAQRISEPDSPLTETKIEKLRRGLDQLNRGEGITMEEVDAKFARWREEHANR